MTPVPLHELGFVLITAIVMGLIARRTWQRGQIRFSERISALGDTLFKRTPEGWAFDSPYPRIFSWRRRTYLLTDAQKERLAERLRRRMRKMRVAIVGSSFLLAIALAFWIRKLPDFLHSLLAGSPRAWLLLCLAYVLTCFTLVTLVPIAQYRLVHPVLRAARLMVVGPAGPLVPIRLVAETTSARALTGRLILVTLALLACGLSAYLAAYLSPSLDTELLLTLNVVFGLAAAWMAVLFALAAVWYVTVLAVKLKAQPPPGGSRGSSGSG